MEESSYGIKCPQKPESVLNVSWFFTSVKFYFRSHRHPKREEGGGAFFKCMHWKLKVFVQFSLQPYDFPSNINGCKYICAFHCIFNTGQPDNSVGQDCAVLNTNEQWHHFNCSMRKHFICEQTSQYHSIFLNQIRHSWP